MIWLACFLSLLAVSQAGKAVDPSAHVATDEQMVLRGDNGEVKFGVDTGDSYRAEMRSDDGEVKGVYSWINPSDGSPHMISYASGTNGYRSVPLDQLGLDLPPYPYSLYNPMGHANPNVVYKAPEKSGIRAPSYGPNTELLYGRPPFLFREEEEEEEEKDSSLTQDYEDPEVDGVIVGEDGPDGDEQTLEQVFEVPDNILSWNIPPGTPVAQSRPTATAQAGNQGAAQAAPVSTAIVGPGGVAIAFPSAQAISGVGGMSVSVPTATGTAGQGGIAIVGTQSFAAAGIPDKDSEDAEGAGDDDAHVVEVEAIGDKADGTHKGFLEAKKYYASQQVPQFAAYPIITNYFFTSPQQQKQLQYVYKANSGMQPNTYVYQQPNYQMPYVRSPVPRGSPARIPGYTGKQEALRFYGAAKDLGQLHQTDGKYRTYPHKVKSLEIALAREAPAEKPVKKYSASTLEEFLSQ